MTVLRGAHQLPRPLLGAVLTMGNFDGLHRGHRALVDQLLAKKQEFGLPAVLVTFDPHPRQVLSGQPVPRITPHDDFISLLTDWGVDYVVLEPFNRELSQLSALSYFHNYIYETFHPKALIVGYDFGFGKDREGDLNFLQKRAEKLCFELKVVEPVKWDGQVVSSTSVRNSLKKHELEEAQKLLGRPFSISGIVEKGDQRGRQIGFPTANIKAPLDIPLPFGVYQSELFWQGRQWPAITNIGQRPTFADDRPKCFVETHVLDENLQLYGEHVEIRFFAHIRNEMKFKGVDELVQQIKSDIVRVRQLIESKNEMG